MLSMYDEFRSCRCGLRNTYISWFHYFFFNVALQHLGPIDQNYVLVVFFLLIFEFRFHEICLICLAHFVNLYYKIHCFSSLNVASFFVVSNFHWFPLHV